MVEKKEIRLWHQSIEFNHIMQMLNEIHIGGAKSQGCAIGFFTFSLSAVFYVLSITLENNLQYIIFEWYFFIMGIGVMILTWGKVKNIRSNFSDRMSGIEKLKRGEKGE